MADWISGYIPNDIETYVEVFGGAFWVYIKGNAYTKPNLSKVIYNDFNRYMVNFFECCRNYNKFYSYIENINSQDEKLFYVYKEELFNKIDVKKINIPDYDLAMKYSYILTQVFSGSDPENSKFIDLKGKYESKFDSFKRRLVDVKTRLKINKITKCENMDFEDVITKYDSESTFFYVDPPYWKTEDYYSLHEFNVGDHKRLADVIKNIDGKFALSYYHFDQLDEWFSRDEYEWTSQKFAKAAGALSGKKQSKGEELLIMNYKLKSINDFI